MNENPAISVVLPVYNAERYLREAVDSILAQTFTDFELILINDGSTDGSGDICRAYGERDPRIVLIDRPNGGLVSALNDGIAKARAPLIARMDADDISMPERFACQYAHMMEHPNLAVLGSAFLSMDSTGQITGYLRMPLTPTKAKDAIERRCPTHHPTVMMRKDAVLKAGGYRTAFTHAEDYDLWLRLSELGYEISNHPQPLLNYRMHGANVSIVHQDKQSLATILAYLSYKMRQAGEPDPLAGVEALHIGLLPGLLQKFPRGLRDEAKARLFTRYATKIFHTGTNDKKTFKQAWQDYLNLDPQIRCNPQMASFLLIFAKATCARRFWVMTLRALIQSIYHHPTDTIRILYSKIKDIGYGMRDARQRKAKRKNHLTLD